MITNVELPDHLPNDIELDHSKRRTFHIITDYMDYDLKGNFRTKTRVSGVYTTGLPGDSIKWNNIRIASAPDKEASFSEGERQEYIDNFSYIQDQNILSVDFFREIPQTDIRVRNLIWDVAGIYWFAYGNWDNLKLNQPYRDKQINNQEMDLSGQGSFENRNAEVTWLGITMLNQENCALIKYSTMNNPLHVNLENMKMTGRSHYWGEIYVSLEDKEIEMATMTEDVVTDVILFAETH
ncbi:hypothetical protein [Marinilabilia salmonicolor]|uniref:hypothetical protein n=1 Tax=Marinilabilia salmonicolor TaxID=989 RepID=UPI0011DF63A6|nr:hypothetical protein [Marinilabilia salmonicolor]